MDRLRVASYPVAWYILKSRKPVPSRHVLERRLCQIEDHRTQMPILAEMPKPTPIPKPFLISELISTPDPMLTPEPILIPELIPELLSGIDSRKLFS